MSRSRPTLLAIVGGAVLVVALLGFIAIDRALRNAALAEAQTVAQADAAILAEGLQSQLEKFSLVPLVLAEDPQVGLLLAGDTASREVINQRLEQLAEQTGAAAIYVTDDEGTTLAASNWRLSTSFVDSNYGFRRYFVSAMADGNATQFALGTVSRRPGLYIAQRVENGGRPLGIVAVKVEFDALEESWRNATAGVFVTDTDGVVLVTSNPDWRFRTTRPQDRTARDREADLQQFGLTELSPMPDLAGSATLVGTSLIETLQPISPIGWDLHLLVDASPRLAAARASAQVILLLALAVSATLFGAAFVLLRRRRARAEAEVLERTARLRDQLHQANRLATLGQVTAGVGHEIRQPVAAVRVFAENGEKLLGAGDTASAQANFGRIIALTERIGKITDELRRFSRRAAAAQPREVLLADVVDGAMLLLGDRIAGSDTVLSLPEPTELAVAVRGEHVGLEQVLVNLLQNALDATGRGGRIALSLVQAKGACRLTVADDGPGLTPEQREKLFQPFATTKPDGLGLGLVISQDIMRSLGGDLVAEPGGGGARFTMVVPLA